MREALSNFLPSQIQKLQQPRLGRRQRDRIVAVPPDLPAHRRFQAPLPPFPALPPCPMIFVLWHDRRAWQKKPFLPLDLFVTVAPFLSLLTMRHTKT